jgi:hypothetical protein
VAAYAFSVKVIDYPSFTFLRSVHADEDDGSLSMWLSGGSELTAPHEATGLMCDDSHVRACEEATPNFLGKGGLESGWFQFQTHILQMKV